ncbi:GDSL-type esterase/lipase family protein [Catellatospora sp. KI3]|uniref:GDSL-type esterase/lipase family protein n=1 Tax=Catellatospora sp. KI3 TaxID=3041620 RepID=UPI0024830CA9|nr:GDSL-type esterase/lipase family protein [Catellatospora sp. KI3]MDI1465410.1 GDSL-type esterase/lipase family protein [Catellatospora sp. KI3]
MSRHHPLRSALHGPPPAPAPRTTGRTARGRRILSALCALAAVAAIAIAGPPAAHAAAPVRVMPLGDSITGGPGCWRAVLWDRLQRNGFTSVDFVGTLPGGGCGLNGWDGDNEGHGGFKATGIADQNQLPGWLAATHPDVVLMHLGTNDIWSNLPTATILTAYGKLVDQMRADNPGIKVLVAQIIPMTPSGCSWCPAGVSALNAAIPAWAAGKSTAQSPVTVVDQFSGFDTAVDTSDGVHPDDSGFQKMSDRWYPALIQLLGGTTPADTTPPSVPTGLSASVNCSLAVTLNWAAATDNVAVTGYDVFRSTNGSTFALVGTTTATSFTGTLNGLAQYAVRARDAAGNTSALTAAVNAVPPPCPPPDTQAPTTPGTPTASGTSATATTLTWAAATDNIGVTGYDVYRAPGASGGTFTSVGTSATTSFTNTGLTAATTYRYQVRARDAVGNLSAFSPAVTVTTASGGGSCAAALTLQTGWSGGYVMQPNTVTNTGTTGISGWTVTFTLPAGHTLTGSWNATVTVSGQTVTARGVAGQNAAVPAGAGTTWGFQASRPSGDTTVPTAAACTAG